MAAPEPGSDAQTIGRTLQIEYRVLANRGEGGCTVPGSGAKTLEPCYEARLTLSAPRALDLTGSKIYFSQIDPVARTGNPISAHISHINGDLHAIEVSGTAARLTAGTPVSIPFTVQGNSLTRAKFMPNYYVVDTQGNAAVIDSTRERATEAMGRKDLPFLAPLPEDLKRAAEDQTPIETPEVTYRYNRGVKFLPGVVDAGIIPSPLSVKSAGGATVDLARGIRPILAGVAQGELDAAFDRLASFGIGVSELGIPLRISVDPGLAIPAEGYELATGPDELAVRASDPAGAFYAVQSLAALVRPGSTRIPALQIEDAPRFSFRGQHLDIARNFHGPDTIRALIEQMAAYKLNTLHLHLADDEGWRLDIGGLPELAEIGARRCHDPSEMRCILPQLGSGPDDQTSGSGYLTGDEYIDILRYAAARHVAIVPAIDMPGHARAAVKAMDARYRRLKAEGASEALAAEYLLSDPADATVYDSVQHYSDNTINVCRASSYRFVAHILDQISALHAAAGTPLERFHIGADETAGAWTASPICNAFLARSDTPGEAKDLGGYFVARISRMVSERGIIPGAWSDGLSHAPTEGLPRTVQSNVWDTLAWGAASTARQHAGKGWQVVISIPDALYFDMPYAAHPEEGGYYWAIRSAPTRKLFSMMPENLPAMAGYWTDRDGQPIPESPGQTGIPAAFAGIQGQVWTETIRDRETLGYQVFPRLLALAERAWHRAPWEMPYGQAPQSAQTFDPALQEDWNRFASIITAKELDKFELAGWSYRLPPPGVVEKANGIDFNTALPGLKIECDVGSGWIPADHCRSLKQGPVRFRTTNGGGTSSSRVVMMLSR